MTPEKGTSHCQADMDQFPALPPTSFTSGANYLTLSLSFYTYPMGRTEDSQGSSEKANEELFLVPSMRADIQTLLAAFVFPS